jgi:hypothetical protein
VTTRTDAANCCTSLHTFCLAKSRMIQCLSQTVSLSSQRTRAEHPTSAFVDDEQFKAAQYTEVWYVWDKITRRVFLFHSNDWTWPLWVWDDPFKASRFFPYFALTFHESVEGMLGKGEVTYYLDQQDALNEMNAAEAKARKDLLGRIIYHKQACVW